MVTEEPPLLRSPGHAVSRPQVRCWSAHPFASSVLRLEGASGGTSADKVSSE